VELRALEQPEVSCELEQDDIGTFPGVSLFTKRGADCIRHTAVYIPRQVSASGGKINVVLWLHGFYVEDHKFLFHNDPVRIREQVRDSNKDVVLISPWLGYEFATRHSFAGNYSVRDLATPKWGERYLNEVLGAISDLQAGGSRSAPPLELGNLVIACHSAGGAAMRNLVGSLGKYESKLRACWGFDCLYGANTEPDDATFWYRWLSRSNDRMLEIVYGPSTLPQSVKLDLMARGIATAEGDKAEPRRRKLENLRVTVGHYDLFSAFGQTVRVNDLDPALVDRLVVPRAADMAAIDDKKAGHGAFLQLAITNVRKAFPFPDDIHYLIARDGFLDRLSKG
jgi:hypothetical protein